MREKENQQVEVDWWYNIINSLPVVVAYFNSTLIICINQWIWWNDAFCLFVLFNFMVMVYHISTPFLLKIWFSSLIWYRRRVAFYVSRKLFQTRNFRRSSIIIGVPAHVSKWESWVINTNMTETYCWFVFLKLTTGIAGSEMVNGIKSIYKTTALLWRRACEVA